jgi:cbb3-type cytochrome oxidase subunit 3
MSGDVVVLLTALGVLFVSLVFACAIAYAFWRGRL